ncbi:uncharacterized protein LOC116007921 [Ipomoea triloba]|uniref:uncharacterized protein LOC116007921 n=1 Tax=Ipomoea triloba TaxID=35885 RepID=UPI00125DA36C|nr:uncharacterized protein LOC116007921 [Ipomoea triloba]
MVVTRKAGSLPKDLRNTLSRGNAQAPLGKSMQPSQQRAEPRAITQLASQLALPVGQPLTHEEERPRMTVTVAEAVGRLLEALGQNPVADVVPDRVDPATKARGQSTGRGQPRHGVQKSGLPCRPEPSRTQVDRQGSHNRQSVFDRLSPENTTTSAPRHARHNPRRRHEEAMRRLKGKEKMHEEAMRRLKGKEKMEERHEKGGQGKEKMEERHEKGGPQTIKMEERHEKGGPQTIEESSGHEKGGPQTIEESSAETPEPIREIQGRKIAELEEEMRNLQRHLKGKDGPTTRFQLSIEPFSAKVQNYKVPKDFKFPSMPTYDGSSDPSDHLIGFQAKMLIAGAKDPMYCRVFVSTLEGIARDWFISLPRGSVSTFEDLANQFLTRFAGSMRARKHFTDLTEVNQGEYESLKDYIKRWQKEIQAVDGIDDKSALMMFMRSLRSGKLFEDLFMRSLRSGKLFEDLRNNTPDTYAQAIQRANRYAETEQALKLKKKQEGGSSSKRPREEIEQRPRDRPIGGDKRRNGLERPSGFQLGGTRTQGTLPLHEVRQVGHIDAPALPPLPPVYNLPRFPNNAKYCRYHRRSGHSTEECTTLQREIESLIHKGRPIDRPTNQSRRPPLTGHDTASPSEKQTIPTLDDRGKRPVEEEEGREEQNWKHSKPVINIIYGGPEGGDSARERKQWGRQLYVGAIQHAVAPKKPRRDPIIFTDDDIPHGTVLHRDALMIAIDIKGTVVRRVFVDTGSSVNVMYAVFVDTGSSVNVMYADTFNKLGLDQTKYADTFNKLGLDQTKLADTFNKLGLDQTKLVPVRTPLAGFTGDSIEAEGRIVLPVEIGQYPRVRKLDMEFVVVKLTSTHNIILGRPGLEDLGAVVSLEHLCLKFRTPEGVGVARCDQRIARSCYLKACRSIGEKDMRIHTIAEKAKQKESVERPEPAVELEEVVLEIAHPNRTVRLGLGLTKEVRESILQVLREYKMIFAWGPEDMPGIDRSVITHRLAVSPAARPVVQRKRFLATERREFVKKEVATLLKIGHIREVKYPTWLANVVLVPKPPAWRMCVDYTDLNKACPKDPFPLPMIDLLVDQTAGCALLSFMDAFRGYHQIFMEKEDEEKTAFITPDGVYCYKVMPFGLKNSGATFTRMIARIFGEQLGKGMETYVDDLLVKSKEAAEHSSELKASFELMKKYNMRLNPKKCAFAVKGGKFLGYMVTQRGIEPNPEKVKAILDMKPPTTLKEVQRLTGCLAALSRFFSKSAERALPFFEVIRKRDSFKWTTEC